MRAGWPSPSLPDDSLFATLAWLLAARDLSLISVWSPTFALNLFEGLERHRTELCDTLVQGAGSAAVCREAPPRAPGRRHPAQLPRPATPELLRVLWPSLSLISAWDTSSSASWARRLQALAPRALPGRGSVGHRGRGHHPLRGKHVLASRSHFYEFVDLATERSHFAWELREGQEVRPLLTTGAGLLRYGLRDRLKVRGFVGSTPCLEFQGRMDDAPTWWARS
ncbi:MAG: GH3 auxin-responsive promoter family protein [Sandaracinaceae bacterium]|nr:GH3 auxin-responsive promoter family protein [Sandaracinaceae bacterium]